MESAAKIRRMVLRDGRSIRLVSRETGLSRNTIRKYLKDSSPPSYRVRSTCLVQYDSNRYSVPARFAGQRVSLRAYADRIKVVAGQDVIAEHKRRFTRNVSYFEPWHYVPLLARKPGLSVDLTDKTDQAAGAQQDASNQFRFATERLLKAVEAHEQGKWRRIGMIALIGALCAAVGFFAREPASKFQHLWDARNELKQNVTSRECGTLDGVNLMVDGIRACVIKENPS